MHADESGPNPSAEQIGWTEIAEAVRVGIFRRAQRTGEMEPDSLQNFVAAARDALLLEQDSRLFDHELQLRAARQRLEE